MPGTPSAEHATDAALLERLRSGDEHAFFALAREEHPALQRIAMLFVPAPTTASQAVCDGWKDALAGLDGIDAATSIRAFVGHHVIQAALRQAERDGRHVPFSALRNPGLVPEASVDAARFRDGDDPSHPGGWRSFPARWSTLDRARACALVRQAIDHLPPAQRALVTLRDVHGWSAAEVTAALGVDDEAQRVHLQRARSKLRAMLDELAASEGDAA